ncbi:unnamed protein product, partial [Discosporangium mesarthrocarpum]
MQVVAEVMVRTQKVTLVDLQRLVARDQGIMGVSKAGKTKTVVTSRNVKASLLILVHHNAVEVVMPTAAEMQK